MAGERMLRILALLTADGAGGDGAGGSEAGRLCTVAAEATEMSGAGILLFDDVILRGSVCSSDPVADHIAELQFSLGEGPGTDAHNSGRVVLEPDLARPARVRWPVFTPPAVARGVCAVFGFPIRLGAARLGALDLYRDRTGPLSDDQYTDAVVMASVAARAILAMQAEAPVMSIAAELLAESDFHFVVHQAAGMISVQLGIGVAEALVVLRAHAFRLDRLVGDLAIDVVNRQKRFDAADSP
jgi:hypothetical protein